MSKRSAAMSENKIENFDTCDSCGKRFDFPEADLTAKEIDGVEILKCWACDDEPTKKFNKQNVKDLRG